MFVLVSVAKEFMQTAYTVGTQQHCREFQLANGLRASTSIIPL